MSLAEAYKSQVPTLNYLDLTYGKQSATIWLVMWISQVYAASGFIKGEVTDNLKLTTSKSIAQEFYYLNLNELMCFFSSFLAGKYKTFYGSPSPQVITSSLQMFLKDRVLAIDYISEDEEQKIVGEIISYDEWKKEKLGMGQELTIEYHEDKDIPVELTPKYKLANMIFYNKGNSDWEQLSELRKSFIQKYKEDPYIYIKKILAETK